MKFKHQDVVMEWNNVTYRPTRNKIWCRDVSRQSKRSKTCLHSTIKIDDIQIDLAYFVSSSTLLEKLAKHEPIDDVPLDIFGYGCTIRKNYGAETWHRGLTTGTHFRTKDINVAEKEAIKWARELKLLR